MFYTGDNIYVDMMGFKYKQPMFFLKMLRSPGDQLDTEPGYRYGDPGAQNVSEGTAIQRNFAYNSTRRSDQ